MYLIILVITYNYLPRVVPLGTSDPGKFLDYQIQSSGLAFRRQTRAANFNSLHCHEAISGVQYHLTQIGGRKRLEALASGSFSVEVQETTLGRDWKEEIRYLAPFFFFTDVDIALC